MLDKKISDSIKLAKIICILCVVLPHIPPYGVYEPRDNIWSAAMWFLNNALGLNSVPLLSFLSGFLLFQYRSKNPFSVLVKRKIETLIIPLVLWNIIYLLKDLSLQKSFNDNVFDAFLAFSAPPLITPLYFLRDIFVCVLLLPLFSRFYHINYALLLLLTANSIFKWDGPIFISSYIPLFFFLGYVAGKCKIYFSRAVLVPALIFSACLLSVGIMYIEFVRPASITENTILLVNRMSGAILMWSFVCVLINKCDVSWISKTERSMFLMFCAHTFFISIFYRLYKTVGGESNTAFHLVLFLMLPFVILICTRLLDIYILSKLPQVRRVLLGNRG